MALYAKTAGGNWSAAGTWSAISSAGVDSVGPPTAADDVIFDALSGNVTIDSGATRLCRSIDCNGYTGTLTHAAATILQIGDATAGAGNIALRFVAGMTYTLSSATTSSITFATSSGTTQTITFAGKTTGNTVFDGTGASWQYTGTQLQAAGCTLTVTRGTLDINGQTCTFGQLAMTASNSQVLTMGASTVTLLAAGGTLVSFGGTNTFNANSSILTSAASGTFAGGGKTFNEVRFTGNVNTTLTGANTFGTLLKSNTANYQDFIISADQTVSTLFSVVGTNATDARILIMSSANGTSRTITCNGTVTLTNVDFMDITAAGSAGTWTGTSLGNGGANSNITFTGAVTRYWVGNGGSWPATTHWSATSGGASGASMPLVHDTAIFDANSFSSGSQSVNVQNGGGSPGTARICSMNWTGVTNSPIFDSSLSSRFFGDIIFASGVTHTSTFGRELFGRGSHSVVMAGGQWAGGTTTVNAGGGTYTFSDAFSSLGAITYISGTLTATANVTITSIGMNGSVTRTINLGTLNTWTLTGTGVWSGSSFGNVTINSQSATIKMTDSSATNKTFGFAGGGPFTYYKVWVATGSTGRVDFIQTSTYTTFKADPGRFIRFNASTTATIGVGGWDVVGTSGNNITMDSSSTTNHTISVASGNVVSDYLTLSDSTATGGATFYAGANSTDAGGGNTGWSFTSPGVNYTQNNNDGVTTTNATAKDVGKASADTVTTTHAVSKAIGRNQGDTVTITHTASKAIGKNVNEAVTATDALSRAISHAIADNVTALHIVAKAVQKVLNDTVTVSDSSTPVELVLPAVGVTLNDATKTVILENEVT